MGVHYEVRPDLIVKWWEPRTITPAGVFDERWYSEPLECWDEVPLGDVILLGAHVATSHAAFIRGNIIVERVVEDHLTELGLLPRRSGE